MKKFIKWLLILCGIFLVFLIGFYFVLSSLFDTRPDINANSYLELNISGYVKEYETQEFLFREEFRNIYQETPSR